MNIIKDLSAYAIPVIFIVILSFGVIKKIKVYETFIEGAKEGISATVKILPSLIGLLVAVGVFRASGALDIIIYFVKPIGKLFSIPSEVLPLAFLRPISGSASLALVSDILKNYGPDSFVGRVASTMMGSTETIFYTLTVYFGCIGIKKTKYTLAAALIADVVGVIVASWVCSFL